MVRLAIHSLDSVNSKCINYYNERLLLTNIFSRLTIIKVARS